MVRTDTTIAIHDLHFRKFIPKERLRERIRELATRLTADYAGRTPVMLGILNGSFIFMADLVRACHMDCETAFVRLTSYHGMHSSGDLVTVIGLTENLQGRHVIVVEDIVDSGFTMNRFLDDLRKLDPASVALVSLLSKPDAITYPVRIDYVGFEITNEFVVGYGLDYNGLGRNLEDLYQLASP